MPDRKSVRIYSKAQRTLKALLKRRGRSLRARLKLRGVDHIQVWRYANARRQPDVNTAAIIDEETDGVVAVADWSIDRIRRHVESLAETG